MNRNPRLLTGTALCAVLLFSLGLSARVREQPTPAVYNPRPSIAAAVDVVFETQPLSQAVRLQAGLMQNTWPPPAVPAQPEPVHYDVRMQPLFASAGLVLERNPFTRAAVIDACVKDRVLPPPTSEIVKTVPEKPKVATRLDLSRFRVIDKTPIAGGGSELEAYADALVQARDMPFSALKAGAKKHLTYPHLFNQPQEYRGEIVQVHGILKRLRKFDKPHKLLQNSGIKVVYEGWVQDVRQYGRNPVCVIFTDLPQGLEVKENQFNEIEFYGYFFKILEYQSAELRNGHEVGRYSPVIIGKIRPPALHIADSDTRGLMTIFLGVLAATLILALGLAFWYRRNDRMVRARISHQASEFLEPPPVEPYDPNYDD